MYFKPKRLQHENDDIKAAMSLLIASLAYIEGRVDPRSLQIRGSLDLRQPLWPVFFSRLKKIIFTPADWPYISPIAKTVWRTAS